MVASADLDLKAAIAATRFGLGARPGEIEVGIITAFIGAPVLIALARRRKLAQL